MRVGLIDVDSHNYPNLCLMKLSAYHKVKGDSVEWYNAFDDRYDLVYMSKVFSFSPDFADHVNADRVIRGGTGYDITLVDGREIYSKGDCLPYEVEHIYPDYSLYGITDTAYGFLTRGCPRACAFCHVAPKEGKKSVKVADLSEFWRGQKTIVLNDPNILACKEWKELLGQLQGSRAKVDINQGMDARLMTREKAEMLKRIKMSEVHFAWDRYNEKDKVLKGLDIYSEYGNKIPSRNKIVYVLCNYDTTIDQDLERIYTLREMGYWAYVTIYDKQHCDSTYRKLQRWVNNRFIFAVCERFEDYQKQQQ